MYKNMFRGTTLLVVLSIISVFSQGVLAQSSPPNEGNWEIDSRVVVSDSTIVLNGDLIVHRGGELELHNVVLKMNCHWDRQYRIKVENGGKLEVYNSEISSNSDHIYALVVDTEGELEIHNSTVVDYSTFDPLSFEENALFTFFLILSLIGIAIVILLILFFLYMRKQRKVVTTTSESLIGKEGMVLEKVMPNTFKGKVKVESRVWSATSEEVIEKDERVRIIEIKGINVVVERVI